MIKVVIVDDEMAIREGIKNAVDWKRYGMEISAVASGGVEALDIIEQNPPDLVILDIILNDIDGLEVLNLIRHKHPNTYVILISGHDDFAYAQRAVELSAYCYLLKPIDEEELCEKLSQISKIIGQRLEKLKKDRELNERIKESIPILRDNFLCRIVRGENINKDLIDSKADFLGLNLWADKYAVLILELHNIENIGEYDKSLLKQAAIEICKDAFSGEQRGYPFNYKDNIGFLICSDMAEQSKIIEICCQVRDKINSELGIAVTLGVGRLYNELYSVRHSYCEAEDALEYKILMGINRVIDPEIIYKSSNKTYERSPVKDVFDKKGSELNTALRSMNHALVKNITSEIITALYESADCNIKNYSKDLLLLSINLSQIAVQLDVNIDTIFEENNELYTTFKQLKTIDEIGKRVESFFAMITEDLKGKQKASNNIHVDKALECINENIYGDISLTTVADKLYVSSNYLSRIFRQEVGEPFIEYTIRVKMNEAKKLLEHGQQKIYEIANELNYKDVNYFSKTFKRVFGITPSEYRELLTPKLN